MIPILYEGTETAFTSNGLGRLSDAISCKVVEERNATYELEMTYPISGIHFQDIQEGRIILAQPHDGGLTEPFEIYRIEKPLNGICTIKAEHISYRLNDIVVMPFSAGTLQETFSSIPAYSATTNPFSFTTDIVSTVDYSIDTPMSVRGMLGGQSGSILDVYGQGDYEFSRWDVILHQDRGADNGVTLRYGKNITDIKNVIDMTNVYTGIVPYWTDGENTVTLPEKVVLSSHTSDFPFYIIKTVDFSSEYEEQPTVAQLRAKAESYVARNEGWKLKNNITVSFVALWNTEEYKHIAALERVQMCDVVHVKYAPLGIDFSTKVVKTDYDVLRERYNSITLGDTYYTLNSYFDEEITNSEEQQTTHMQKAIARATKLIQGGLGGHVVFNTNADGEPQEILIMDTDDIATATNVIRMNMNGIGFSTSGYNGPFETAWTIDGHFVADFIDSGTLNANVIKAGIIADEAELNYWNMETGDFRLAANNGLADGIKLTSGSLVINGTYITTGTIDASKANITNINASNINTGTLDASVVNVTNLNADHITTGHFSADLIRGGQLIIDNDNYGSMAILVKRKDATKLRIDYRGLYIGDGTYLDYITLSADASKGKIVVGRSSQTIIENDEITVGSKTNSTNIDAGTVTINHGTSTALDVTGKVNISVSTGVALTVSTGGASTATALSVSGKSELSTADISTLSGAINATTSKIGFFGGTSQSKQTVNKLSSSATKAQIITKVNDLLTALKNYSLISSI